jgi:hypothetical protein
MPSMRNQKEIETVLNRILLDVINEVSVLVRKELQEEIKESVYEFDYFPNKFYEGGSGNPSFEFEESFRWKETRVSKNEVSKQLFNSWQSMTVDKLTGRHFEGGKDMRSKMADLLNVDGVVGHKERSAYWDNFVSLMDNEIDTFFLDAIKKRGLSVTENTSLAGLGQGLVGVDLKTSAKNMANAIDKFLYDIYPSLI